jgi:hypothetical protein
MDTSVDGVGGDVGDELDVLPRRQAGDQVVELKDEADVAAPEAGEHAVGGAAELEVAKAERAAGGHVQPTQDVEKRRLAGARGPEQHHELAGVQVQAGAAQRHHLDLPHGIDPREVAGGEDHRPRGGTDASSGRERDGRGSFTGSPGATGGKACPVQVCTERAMVAVMEERATRAVASPCGITR